MKVLVSAYACEPGKGSEPGVGWNWVRQISRTHDVWVLTRESNRMAIESALQQEPLPRVHWVYFDLPLWMRFWKRGTRGVHAYYCLWQLGAYVQARKLHQRVGLDLVHHLTFVNYWLPSFLALLPVPFLWGPVGGGESAPRVFLPAFSLRGKIHELLRDSVRALAALNPLTRLAARRAALALATAPDTERRLRALGCRSVMMYSEAGLTADEIEWLGSFPFREGAPFRVLSVGRLLHWKGFDLGLRAFERFHRALPDSELWLAGDGPERERLERLSHELGISDKVTFWGNLPRAEVLRKLSDCDVVLHPSLHDSGGWVCLEAMAAGCPVVCLDLGGPGVQVARECGLKVPAISPEQVVEELDTALQRLAGDAGLRARLGRGGRRRARELFCWEQRMDFLTEIYSRILATARREAC